MVDPVDWGLAEKVAVRVAGREPLAASYHYDRLTADFEELTAQAEALVERATGLRSASGPARARVVDRGDWVRANLASFDRLLRPLTERMAERLDERRGPAAAVSGVSRRAAGVEVGALLGWMATRVLGQYDLLIIEDEAPDDQDLVYYVGPNVLALEKRFGFPPREFRLWLALHEVTHRAQFTGVPWLRSHFLSLVNQTLDAVDPDPKRFLDAAGAGGRRPAVGPQPARRGRHRHAARQPRPAAAVRPHRRDDEPARGARRRHHGPRRRGPRAVRAPVLAGAARASPAGRQHGQGAAEGHGHRRQDEAVRPGRVVHRLRRAPRRDVGASTRAWRGPEWLPTLAEIRAPQEWLDRVRLSEERPGRAERPLA